MVQVAAHDLLPNLCAEPATAHVAAICMTALAALRRPAREEAVLPACAATAQLARVAIARQVHATVAAFRILAIARPPALPVHVAAAHAREITAAHVAATTAYARATPDVRAPLRADRILAAAHAAARHHTAAAIAHTVVAAQARTAMAAAAAAAEAAVRAAAALIAEAAAVAAVAHIAAAAAVATLAVAVVEAVAAEAAILAADVVDQPIGGADFQAPPSI